MRQIVSCRIISPQLQVLKIGVENMLAEEMKQRQHDDMLHRRHYLRRTSILFVVITLRILGAQIQKERSTLDDGPTFHPYYESCLKIEIPF